MKTLNSNGQFHTFTPAYLLVHVDEWSRFTWTVPIASKSAEHTLDGLYHWLRNTLGLVRAKRALTDSDYRNDIHHDVAILQIHTDRGTEFGGVFAQKLLQWNICHSTSPPYQQHKNGIVEGHIRLLKDLVRVYYDKHDRCSVIDFAQCCTSPPRN